MKRNKIISIFCRTESNIIGADNKLLLSFPKDLKNFKKLTTDNVVVMGYNTFVSLNRVNGLPDRTNIVFTRDNEKREILKSRGIKVCNGMEEFFKLYNDGAFGDKDIYIIGGASVYKQFEPYIDEAVVTTAVIDDKHFRLNGKTVTRYMFNRDFYESCVDTVYIDYGTYTSDLIKDKPQIVVVTHHYYFNKEGEMDVNDV